MSTLAGMSQRRSGRFSAPDCARKSWKSITPTIKAGEVILQAPQEGTTLRKNDVVVLTVSKGPSTQTVPKITNLTVSDAITTLSPYGLTLTIVEYVVSATVPAGRIISQSPEEGSVCMSGDAVSVSVSGGMAVVPNVYGAASGGCAGADCGIGIVAEPEHHFLGDG